MDDLSVARDIGGLSVAVTQLRDSVVHLEQQVEAIQSTLSEAKGGWKIILWMAGASGASGAIVAALIEFFGRHPR